MDAWIVGGLVIVAGGAIYYGLGEYLQSENAINRAKDLKAQLVDLEPYMAEEMQETYKEALATLDCYIAGTVDGVLTWKESVALSWAGYRLGRAAVRAAMIKREEYLG